MVSNRLGILAVLAICILPALAQVPDGSTAPLTSTAFSPLQHKPMKFHRVRIDGSVESENWSGYAVTGSGFTSVRVSPGNVISAQVSYSGTEFTTTITNETTGASFSRSARVRGAARSSAEWIAEAPCCTSSGGILPLSDFGTASFGEEYTGISETNFATETSTSGQISAFGSNVQEIIMVSSSGAEEALPSALTSDGTSFQVAWKSE